MSAAAECVVIGGGLAGAMAGLCLAHAGRDVLLIERERGRHAKVCGEFLSPEAVGYLRAAAVEPLELGAAAIHGLRVATARKVVEAELPFAALSLSRTVLDEALLARAAEAGCRVRRGVGVEGLAREGGRWTARLADGSTVTGGNVFLATGKHDLRGWARGAGRQNDLVGFKLHWRLAEAQTAALRGWMDLFLFRGGYGGLALVEDGIANLCLVVRREELRRLGGWEQLLRDLLDANGLVRQRLAGAEALWERPLAISAIPYGYLAAREVAGDGLWRLGDQAAVIPSFTGDGMSIALHSAALATECFLRGGSAAEYQAGLVRDLRGGMGLATGLSRLMVTVAGQRMAPAALAVAPGMLGAIARRTRIPEAALKQWSVIT
ncbi:MAG: NAD(P)/FAD-dependent oxidoreductase [Acidobacteriota bacterium]